jgi:fumarate reductase subunit C
MSAPTTYRQPVSRLWWLKKRTYFLFVMRELSSVFVAWFAVFLMIMVFAIGRGEASYQKFLNWAASPVVIVINIVALAFLVLHTVTWFVLTPQAMVVRAPGRGRQVSAMKEVRIAGRLVPAATVVRVGNRVPSGLVIASQYAALAVVSAFIVWLVLR